MSLKRSTSAINPPVLRRAKPDCVGYKTFAVVNLEDGQTVHQACLLIIGQCHSFSATSELDFVSVSCNDGFTKPSEPLNWPAAKETWKALVMLSPGANFLEFQLHHAREVIGTHKLIVNYVPLLQLPPLHLAIMVAKDSPLLIDCPPSKHGAISSAHSSLDAAISKFRTTAYMWQALTAEDFRAKGIGRRSFRLDEEWNIDTTTRTAHQTFTGATTAARCVPKVHIVRTGKSLSELRDPNFAQQNSEAQDPMCLHRVFEDALRAYGGPFTSSTRPVVAGMILDSSYSMDTNLIHAHAALGCHKPNGLSLGIFGSHLTYSWPRFIEEVPACLLDNTPTGDTVGNDNGECNTMCQASFVGQGAFLHEVGHAFGADHTTGIMARGYSKHWARNFLAHNEDENDAKWDLQDALRFRLMPHFMLPGDKILSKSIKNAGISVKPTFGDLGDQQINITCAAGIAWVKIFNGKSKEITDFTDEAQVDTTFPISFIKERYIRSEPLRVEVLAMNGKQRTIKDVWHFLEQNTFIHVPGHSDLILSKESVKAQALENDNRSNSYHKWALLLNEKGFDGNIHRATAIDLRVGCWFDGAVVYYADGHRTNCGVADQTSYGGHASEKKSLLANSEITKVEIRRPHGHNGALDGIRMTLADGSAWGELHDAGSEDYHQEDSETILLEPSEGDRIVGFFGQSAVGFGDCFEFGIITAPKDTELPQEVYEMKELQNRVNIAALEKNSERDGANGHAPNSHAEGDEMEDREEYDYVSDHTMS